MKDKQKRDEITEDNIYPIGVAGVVNNISRDGYIVVKVNNRVNIDEVIIDARHHIELNISRRIDTESVDPNYEKERLTQLKGEAKELASRFQYAAFFNKLIDIANSIGELNAILSHWMNIFNEDKYNILKEDSAVKRMEMMEQNLVEFIEVTKVTTDATSAQEQEYKDMYKESAIKKQMEYLQKELDEMRPENVSSSRKVHILSVGYSL